MKLTFSETGDPAQVLHLEPSEAPIPAGHEVTVRMLYAPINPADLNYIEGVYGKTPALPALPGIEGCGRVEAIGPRVESLAVGDLVIPLRAIGLWAHHYSGLEQDFAKLPAGMDPLQACMLRVNPATAWQLLHDFRELEAGAFVAQNAANSGVGRALIQIAKHLGLKTINFVRRPELIEELKALGADHVFLDDENGLAQAHEALGKTPLTLALNAVGGDSALRLMQLLSPVGAHITYGAMSRRSLKVPNSFLIFKDLEIRGYWLSHRMEKASHGEIHDVLKPLADMMTKGTLKLPIAQIFPLDQFREAILAAQAGGRSGKIVLDLSAKI
jgi:mitochondrial enoyl-[acyl-carrier protein] reductase / trans-2-enoyl-CoA reductase